MVTQDFPPLFSPKGEFTPYPQDVLDSLSPQRLSLYESVRDAAGVMVAADAELKAATDNVRACMDAVATAEKNMPAKRSFHSLWQETCGRPRNGR